MAIAQKLCSLARYSYFLVSRLRTEYLFHLLFTKFSCNSSRQRLQVCNPLSGDPNRLASFLHRLSDPLKQFECLFPCNPAKLGSWRRGTEWGRDETRGAFYCPMSPLSSTSSLSPWVFFQVPSQPPRRRRDVLLHYPPRSGDFGLPPHPTQSIYVQQLYRLPQYRAPPLPLSSVFGPFLTNFSCSRMIGYTLHCVVRNTNRPHAVLRQDRIVSLPPSSIS